MRTNFLCIGVIGVALAGCQQSSTSTQLRSLAGSGRVSLVCRDALSGEGRDVRACPAYQDSAVDVKADRHMLALLTQTLRGEVAVVDLTDQKVLDTDPWVPGTEFLTVGADPKAIVSTPGGFASFVAVAKPGLEAIFALPTSCITAPNSGEPARDLTLWAACRLPGRPGEMAIVTDRTPSEVGYRQVCPNLASATDAGIQAWVSAAQSVNAQNDSNPCAANLALEEGIAPAGRRKLLVTLPDLGKIALYDAQAILNLGSGSFQECIPDSVIALSSAVPTAPVVQPLPTDLQTADSTGKLQTEITYAAEPFVSAASGADPQPAGIALADGKLYVADLNIPLIHVVDVSDPCNAREERDRPLRPLSYDNPSEPVYTRDLSVSSVTVAGEAKKQRFLYAIETPRRDGRINASIGSAMVFDLSEGASPAPVVRPRSMEISFEPSDRIRFESPISKLQLITHDAPELDPATETAQVGVLCDPYPSSQSVGTLYRTNEDFTEGAGPRKLRGIFGVMALGSGQLAAVDIEDWDAPCRRPASNNQLSGMDWLGCQHDPVLGSGNFAIDEDTPTVTDESSCNVVEPHRFRSATYYRADSTLGVHAPSVAAFPRLSSKESGDLPTGTSDIERKYPQMLAVPFQDFVEDAGESVNAFLNVGSARFELSEGERYHIDRNPADAVNNSLLLPLGEPRAYTSQEQFTAIFEGTVVAERGSGFLPENEQELMGLGFNEPIEAGSILLRDGDAQFCSRGVEDYRTALETARRMLPNLKPGEPADAAKLTQFARLHADFVVLTGDFSEDDVYFKTTSKAVPDQCQSVLSEGGGTTLRDSCEALFGTYEEPVGRARELMIREAQADDLLLTPLGTGDPAVWASRVHCCFPPTAHRYEVRAGNQWVVGGNTFFHHMTGTAESACHRDPDPRRAKFRGRALEIASRTACGANLDACGIGPATELDPCVVEQTNDGVAPSAFGVSLPAECLFDSIKARFAIYRGQQPSVRDMMFKWKVTGGFSTLSSPITTTTSQYTVAPVDMVYSESLGALVVVDGGTGGLSLIGLQSFAPMRDPFL